MENRDASFVGTIPEVYETRLVPLIFDPYATELARRVEALPGRRMLELAAGTGVATRALAETVRADVSIVATDLNEPMLETAKRIGTRRPVEWRPADAQNLPFRDGSFDAVVCQFGVMFFPDRAAAFAEAARVLAPGGTFVFSVWDRIEDNEFADAVTHGLATVFSDDPPRFLPRVPHGYFDTSVIARDLAAGGFATRPAFTTVTERSRAATARDPAIAYCLGTPLLNDIEERDASRVDEAVDHAAAEVERRFGPGPVDGKIQAIVVTIDA